MVTLIHKLFALPSFDEEDQARVAQVLNFSLWVVLLAAGLFALATPFLMPERMPRLPITLGLFALSVGMLYLLRSGRVRLTALCFTASLWLLFSYAAFTSGNMNYPGFILQTVTVVVAALTLGGRSALIFAGLSGVLVIAMYAVQGRGRLPPAEAAFTPFASMIIQLVSLFIIALLLHHAARHINDSLERTRQSERRLAEHNRQLEIEIAERKRIELELRDSQARLTDAQLIGNIGTWESNLITGEEIWSDETSRHLGLEPGAVKPTFELFLSRVHPDDRAALTRDNNRPLVPGYAGTSHYRVLLPEGGVRYIAFRAGVKGDAEGNPVRLVGVMQDITAQKEVEIALRDSEELLRLATDAARVGIWDWNVVTDEVKWSDRTYEIIGETRLPEIKSVTDFRDRVYPDDLPIVDGTLERVGEGNRIDIGDFRIVMPDGRVRWVHEQAKVYYDAAGQPARVVGVIQDIAERKQTEQILREQTEILGAIFDHIPLMIAVFDPDWNFKLVNRAWEYTLGWSLEQLRQDSNILGNLYPEAATREAVLEFVNQATAQWGDFQLVTRDGRELDTAWANIRLSNGMIIGIGQDITERKQAEQQRLELAVEKERVALLKEFIGNMSHDLKTPLSVLNTSLYLLERLPDPDYQHAKIDTMKQQILLLERLIQDILTMSRLDHTPELILKAVDLCNLIIGVESKLRPSAESKGVTTILELDEQLPPVLASEGELYRALVNLIENAIKYTPANAAITIRARSDGAFAIVEVADTGMGIREDELPHIFDRFFRADRARSLDTPGTGLGLSIVKRIVEMHHGRIEVDSQPGQGSVFRVALPLVG